jgi:peptidoglycan/LPS O-acetylase OafA/YrhL
VAGSAILILCLCREAGSIPARLLTTRPMKALGHMSCSLYLTHFPVVALLFPWVRYLHGEPSR